MSEPDKRPVTLEELLVSSLAQTDALAKLLIEKGLITRKEFMQKISKERARYQKLLNPTLPVKEALNVVVMADLESAWLKVNVPALTAGNTQNLLMLRTNDNRCFRSSTTTKTVSRSRADNVLTEGNEKFDLLRWCEIGNRHGIYEDPNCASRTHKTSVTLDNGCVAQAASDRAKNTVRKRITPSIEFQSNTLSNQAVARSPNGIRANQAHKRCQLQTRSVV
jgi:hypothetical protein